eukprot:gene21665-148_t
MDSTQCTEVLSQKDITFIVTPPEIVFRNYEPFRKYNTTLQFKNQTISPKNVRVLPPESRFFSISEPRANGDTLTVAAGLSVTYTVSFHPEEDADYECDLICITSAERFIVPVKAIASRGKLNLPKSVSFASAPVKYESEKTLFVRNGRIKMEDGQRSKKRKG